MDLYWHLISDFDWVVFSVCKWKSLTRGGSCQLEQILTIFCQKVRYDIKKGLNIRSIARMALVVCKLQRLSKIYGQMLLIQCCQEFFVVLKYIGFKRKSGVSTGSTFSALTVKREIQKKTAFRSGTPLLLSDHAISSWLYQLCEKRTNVNRLKFTIF